MVPDSDRANKNYAGFYLCLKTVDLGRNFRLVHEESTPAEYQEESAKNSLIIGLSSWFIQDGNYRDFKRGDQVAFALEFIRQTCYPSPKAEITWPHWSICTAAFIALLAELFMFVSVSGGPLMLAF